jgi:hypothetical protein
MFGKKHPAEMTAVVGSDPFCSVLRGGLSDARDGSPRRKWQKQQWGYLRVQVPLTVLFSNLRLVVFREPTYVSWASPEIWRAVAF